MIGQQQFEHFEFENISAYLLVNKQNNNTYEKFDSIKEMVVNTYPDILNL